MEALPPAITHGLIGTWWNRLGLSASTSSLSAHGAATSTRARRTKLLMPARRASEAVFPLLLAASRVTLEAFAEMPEPLVDQVCRGCSNSRAAVSCFPDGHLICIFQGHAEKQSAAQMLSSTAASW